jgi:hypothetical protein
MDSKPDDLPLFPGSSRLGAPAKYSLPKAIYRNRSGLELKAPDGTVACKLLKNELWQDKHTITDAKGNKLIVLRREIVFPAAHAKFTQFSYKPNFEGQESNESDADGVPVYPFSQLRCVVPSMPPKYEYLLYKTDNLKPELHSVINSVCSSRKRGTMTDLKDQLMLRFEEFITGKDGAGYIDVEVAAGIDPLQAIMIGIIIDEETTRSS